MNLKQLLAIFDASEKLLSNVQSYRKFEKVARQLPCAMTILK